MPGFTLLCALNNQLEHDRQRFERLLQYPDILEEDRTPILWDEATVLLGTTAYPAYPSFSYEDDTWRVYLEGRIHQRDRSEVVRDLLNLLPGVVPGDEDGQRRLRNWLLDSDGEFVVVLLNKPRQQLFLLNDALARLPVYYHANQRVFVLSRNIRSVQPLLSVREYDRLSIAHYLLWGYYTQPRTYLKNVFRLKPASLVSVNLRDGSSSIRELHVLNFDDKQQPEEGVKDNAAKLSSLFAKACANRAAADAGNLLSLSGGLDSRSVAAGLHAQGIPFRATTYLDFEQARAFDVEVAKRIARLFQLPHTLFQLKAPTGGDFLKMLRIKNGFNYLGAGFLIQYFAALQMEYGRGLRYFSGNGGDRLMQYFRPPNIDFRSVEQLVQYLVNRRRFFTLDEIGDITRTGKQDILDSLAELVASFPEQDFNQKFVHAELYGDGLSRHLEGEDRIRAFFWTASPFWSIHFVRQVMRVPDHQKQAFNLYRHFLAHLSPEAAAIVYPNANARIGSLRHRLFVASKDLRWFFFGRFRKSPTHYAHSPDLVRCLQSQVADCQAIGDWLSVPAMRRVIDNASRYKHEAIESLFTIASIIEDLETGRSSLRNYADAAFSVPSTAWDWHKHRPLRPGPVT